MADNNRVLNFTEFAGKYNQQSEQDAAASYSEFSKASDNFQDGFDEDTYEEGQAGPNRPIASGEETTPLSPDSMPTPTQGMEAPHDESEEEEEEADDSVGIDDLDDDEYEGGNPEEDQDEDEDEEEEDEDEEDEDEEDEANESAKFKRNSHINEQLPDMAAAVAWDRTSGKDKKEIKRIIKKIARMYIADTPETREFARGVKKATKSIFNIHLGAYKLGKSAVDYVKHSPANPLNWELSGTTNEASKVILESFDEFEARGPIDFQSRGYDDVLDTIELEFDDNGQEHEDSDNEECFVTCKSCGSKKGVNAGEYPMGAENEANPDSWWQGVKMGMMCEGCM